ncbi:MAG: hypothetical protein EHM55_16980 [Acidobacteria bacterium]|nr:MAG: hypothetical protein EHM55_16980 [Acidobacteriota bacterium]
MLPVIPLLGGDLRQKWPAIAAVSALAATAMYLAAYGVRMPAMGNTRVSSYEFSRWIGENPGVVYLLERNAEP